MSLSVPTSTKFRYEGNGVTNTFAYNARVTSASDLVVQILTRATDAVVETLALNTDYSVTISTAGTASITVTNALKIPSGTQDIFIYRVVPQTQPETLPSGTTFPSQTVERALDRLTVLLQDTEEKIGRSLRLPITSSITEAEIPLPLSGALLGWNSDATEIENKIAAEINLATVSAYISTLLGASDSAAARTILEALGNAAGAVGTANLADAAVTTPKLAAGISPIVSSINGDQFAGFRNVIDNGSALIWQRGATGVLTTSYTYFADRWVGSMAGTAAGVFNRSTSVPANLGFQFSKQFGRNNGSALTGAINIGTVLRTARSLQLAGRQVTLSYYARRGANYSGASNNLNVILRAGTGTDQSSANAFAGAWTGASSPINTTAALTTSWQRFSHTVTLGAITQLGVQFGYTPTGTAGADDNVFITGVQLEAGSQATPFEHRGFTQERMLCMAEFYKTFDYAIAPAQNAGGSTGELLWTSPVGASALNRSQTFGFPVPMLSAPTVVFFNPQAANAQVRDFSAGADCSGTAAFRIGQTTGVSIQFTTAAGTVVGNPLAVHLTASCEL